MKFVLFVEGYTERKALPEFLKRWLDAQLPRKVGIKVVRFEGWSHYRDDIAKKVATGTASERWEYEEACLGT